MADLNVKLSDITPLIDKKWLFNGLWQLKQDYAAGEKALKKILKEIERYKFSPKCIFKKINLSDQFDFNDSILKHFTKGRSIDDGAFLGAATIGGEVIKESEKIKSENRYADYFYLYGFSAALVEAVTEYMHQVICKDTGIDMKNTFRISPGYPVWPNLKDQKKIDKLLDLKQIGVELSTTYQLVPEFSTTALVVVLGSDF